MSASGSPIDPSFQFVSHTKSDTVPVKYNGVPKRTKGIYVGGSGDVAVKNDLGTSVVFTGLAGGLIHPISAEYIMSTGTTATSIVAVF